MQAKHVCKIMIVSRFVLPSFGLANTHSILFCVAVCMAAGNSRTFQPSELSSTEVRSCCGDALDYSGASG